MQVVSVVVFLSGQYKTAAPLREPSVRLFIVDVVVVVISRRVGIWHEYLANQSLSSVQYKLSRDGV